LNDVGRSKEFVPVTQLCLLMMCGSGYSDDVCSWMRLMKQASSPGFVFLTYCAVFLFFFCCLHLSTFVYRSIISLLKLC